MSVLLKNFIIKTIDLTVYIPGNIDKARCWSKSDSIVYVRRWKTRLQLFSVNCCWTQPWLFVYIRSMPVSVLLGGVGWLPLEPYSPESLNTCYLATTGKISQALVCTSFPSHCIISTKTLLGLYQ